MNAVTLTPALCALMLKSTHGKEKKKNLLQRFFGLFNRGYDALAGGYRSVITYLAARRVITVLLLLVFIGATWGISIILPTGFIPTEDQGVVYIDVTTPAGATVERTERVLDQIERVAS